MNNRVTILLAILLLSGVARAQGLQDVVESRRDCATCHLEWSADFSNPSAVLLMDKPTISMASRESVCLGCHDGAVRDSRKKVWQEQSHRTGVVPPATMHIPTTLPLEDGKLACRTCHTAHNLPSKENLGNTFFLRIDNDKSQLCQACHAEKNVGPKMGSHPTGKLSVPVPAELIAAGAKSGPPGAELICQSCHAAHGSKAEKLLVLTAGNSALCATCHDKQKPGMFEPDSMYGHPFNRPLQTVAQRQAITDMGTHIGPRDTLVCLSCHRMHDSKTTGNLLADTMADGKLCLRCHEDRAIVAGTKHDMRKMAPTTRNVLGQTALEAGPCGACHEPHQPARTPVVSAGDPKGLCSNCHNESGIAAKAGPAHDHHPEVVNRSDLPGNLTLAVMVDRNDSTRADVTCRTCHDPHDPTRTNFLRDTPDALCGRCHVDQATHLIGQHDFTKRPDAKNGLGKTAAETGKCGFCHNVHKATGAVMWVATTDAPTTARELCVDCHQAGGLAAKYPAPAFSHPTGAKSPATRPAAVPLPLFDAAGHRVAGSGLVECASCHNPHADGTKSPLLLRVTGSTSDLCLRCHSEKSTLDGSIHDSRTHQTWPVAASGKSGDDLCMGCHRAHGTTSLWAVTPAANQPAADGVCIACHTDHAWSPADEDMPNKGSAMHPQKLAAGMTCTFPLVAPVGSDERTQIGCKTCHDPHAGRGTIALLRAPSADHPESLCFSCHNDASGLDKSRHAAPVLAAAGVTQPGAKLPCAPCHSVHAGDSSHRDKLWSGKLDTLAATGNEQRCLGCHDDQTARHPEIPQHPQVAFGLLTWRNTAATQPAYLPGDQSIPCNVCHLPHGPTAASSPDIPAKMRGPFKVMLRPNVQRDLCATCHGSDAGRVLLYYHHAQERHDVQELELPPEAAAAN